MKRILRFTASWCGPCQGLAMNLETASLNLPIEVIDIDTHNDIAQEYGVRSVPTLVMLDENTEIKRLIGSRTVNQLQEWAQ
jgi:thioredoxin-like negative regulator of GroEL